MVHVPAAARARATMNSRTAARRRRSPLSVSPEGGRQSRAVPGEEIRPTPSPPAPLQPIQQCLQPLDRRPELLADLVHELRGRRSRFHGRLLRPRHGGLGDRRDGTGATAGSSPVSAATEASSVRCITT